MGVCVKVSNPFTNLLENMLDGFLFARPGGRAQRRHEIIEARGGVISPMRRRSVLSHRKYYYM